MKLCLSGFRPSYETGRALTTLVDDVNLEMDRGNVTLLIFLDLLTIFSTIIVLFGIMFRDRD